MELNELRERFGLPADTAPDEVEHALDRAVLLWKQDRADALVDEAEVDGIIERVQMQFYTEAAVENYAAVTCLFEQMRAERGAEDAEGRALTSAAATLAEVSWELLDDEAWAGRLRPVCDLCHAAGLNRDEQGQVVARSRKRLAQIGDTHVQHPRCAYVCRACYDALLAGQGAAPR